MSQSATESKSIVRSEDELGKKIDRCLANGLLKVGGGLGIGIIFSVLLFKRRSWPITFGTGVGLGMSFSNCQNDFQSPYLIRGKKVKASEVAQSTTPSTDYLVVAPDKRQTVAHK